VNFYRVEQMGDKTYLNRIICGDTLSILKNMPDEIVDVGVTSPPYNKGENKKGWLVSDLFYYMKNEKI